MEKMRRGVRRVGQPLKILYIASTDGHLRSFHLPCLRALAQQGHLVTAAGAGDGHGLPEGAAFLPVPFTKSFVSPKNFRAAGLVRRAVRENRYDLILTHTSLAAFFTRLGVLLAGKRDARVVNTVHGYLFDENSSLLRRAVMLAAEKLTAPVTDDILVMNRADEDIARRHRLCRDRVIPVPGMGVELARFAPASAEERRDARRELRLPEDAFVLLCAAEFSRRKNQALLMEALARLPEDVFLLLPGEGALRERCMVLAEKKGLAGRVVFPGQMADVRPALRAADLCVSASRSEGLPFHVMEAMAAALPCVLSDVKGHRDLLAGGGGRLYPFGDAAALAAAVEGLRANSDLRSRMGETARREVQKYDLSAALPRVLAGYGL